MTTAPKYRFTDGRQTVETSRGARVVPKGALVSDAVEFDSPELAAASLRADLNAVHRAVGHAAGLGDLSDWCLREPCIGIRERLRLIEQEIPQVVQ